MCTQLHMLRHSYNHAEQESNVERQNFQGSSFVIGLTTSDKGFFESIASTLYNETQYSSTPARPQ